jgi:hypothetical protein
VGGTRLRIALVGAALAALVVVPAARAAESGLFGWSVAPQKLPKERRAPAKLRLEYRSQAPDGRASV